MTVCRSSPRVSRLRRGNPRPGLGACVLAWQLNCEAPAPLLAATAEHCSSPLGLHARAKPVSLDTALVARTIRRLTHGLLQNVAKKPAMQTGKVIRCRGIDQETWAA